MDGSRTDWRGFQASASTLQRDLSDRAGEEVVAGVRDDAVERFTQPRPHHYQKMPDC